MLTTIDQTGTHRSMHPCCALHHCTAPFGEVSCTFAKLSTFQNPVDSTSCHDSRYYAFLGPSLTNGHRCTCNPRSNHRQIIHCSSSTSQAIKRLASKSAPQATTLPTATLERLETRSIKLLRTLPLQPRCVFQATTQDYSLAK
jgi:hypothetical protein